MIKTQCSNCDSIHDVSPQYINHEVECTTCQHVFRVEQEHEQQTGQAEDEGIAEARKSQKYGGIAIILCMLPVISQAMAIPAITQGIKARKKGCQDKSALIGIIFGSISMLIGLIMLSKVVMKQHKAVSERAAYHERQAKESIEDDKKKAALDALIKEKGKIEADAIAAIAAAKAKGGNNKAIAAALDGYLINAKGQPVSSKNIGDKSHLLIFYGGDFKDDLKRAGSRKIAKDIAGWYNTRTFKGYNDDFEIVFVSFSDARPPMQYLKRTPVPGVKFNSKGHKALLPYMAKDGRVPNLVLISHGVRIVDSEFKVRHFEDEVPQHVVKKVLKTK